jgi:thioredoxin reductase
MQDNKIYETIIIGAEPDGLALAETLAKAGLSVAIFSSNFIHNKNYVLDTVDLVEKTCVYISFTHGLFGVTAADRSAIFGRSIVLATGTKPIKANLKSLHIAYKAQDVEIKDKHTPAVVFGNNALAVSSALEMSKQFRYIYLCSNTFELDCSKRLLTKLANTPNIVHLPGCNVIGCKNNKEGKLSEVALDTYATIKASALLMALGRTPDVPACAKKFLAVDEAGYAIVTAANESTKVPLVFAIGNVLKKPARKDINKIAQRLLSYFKES